MPQYITGESFMPHGLCLVWNPALIGLHVASDAVIALAYYSIPFALSFFVSRRRDLAYPWMFILFAAFILACGTTHILDIWTLWQPDYLLQGIVKGLTAVISIISAIVLWPVLKQALLLPSPSQLRQMNEDLSREITRRRETVQRLEAEVFERQRLEEKLRQNEARLQAVLDTAVEGILMVGPDGHIELCNPAAALMFGYTIQELTGRGFCQILSGMDSSIESLAACSLTTNGINVQGPREHTGLRKDGTLFPLEISTGIYQDDGTRLTCVLRDITARRATERAIREQQNELFHIHRLSTVGELAAMTAHELNQPLTAIANYLGGIRLRFDPVMTENPKLAEAIDETIRLSVRTSQIVQGIRDLIRKQKSDYSAINVRSLIEETLVLLSPELEKRSIVQKCISLDDVPEIQGQRIQLQQLLLNLILNAIEAMDHVKPESRTLEIMVSRQDPGIVISIEDTGPGLPESLKQHIFDPFISTKPNGIGLGLPICKSIVEAHGGEISVDASRVEGCMFKVKLPCKKA